MYIRKLTDPEISPELKLQMKIDPHHGHSFIRPATDTLLTWTFLCMHGEREISGLSSFSSKDISPIRLGPYPYITPFNLNYLLKSPISNTVTLSGKGLRLGLQHTNFGETQFSP